MIQIQNSFKRDFSEKISQKNEEKAQGSVSCPLEKDEAVLKCRHRKLSSFHIMRSKNHSGNEENWTKIHLMKQEMSSPKILLNMELFNCHEESERKIE